MLYFYDVKQRIPFLYQLFISNRIKNHGNKIFFKHIY